MDGIGIGQPRRLDYEQTFDNGRRSLVRRGSDFTLTFFPRPTFGTVVMLVVHTITALFCLMAGCWPTGTTVVGGVTVDHPGGICPRLIVLLLASFLILGFVGTFQHFRRPTTVALDARTLTVRTPGLWGYSERRAELSVYDRVWVGRDEDRMSVEMSNAGGTLALTLLSSQGNSHFTRRDLEHVRRLVRRAFAERRMARSRRVPASTTASPGSPPSLATQTSR